VYHNDAQNISDAQVHEQIRVLNEDFRRQNADRINTPAEFLSVAGDANIEFRLARIDPHGNPTTGITRTHTDVNGFSRDTDQVKFTGSGGRNAWNTQRYLNIWVCYLADPITFAYAQFPEDFVTKPNTDGIVIGYRHFGVGGHTQSPTNLGRTTTHEVGHWLALRHLCGDDEDCSVDDGVDDTPSQRESMRGCYSFPKQDPCSELYPGIMFMNFMDLTDDACKNLFTKGQVARMRALFDTQTGVRRQLLEAADIIINPPGIAASTHTICPTATYTLSNNLQATWSVPSNSGFTITPPYVGVNSIEVRATRLDGQSTTLTATINGVPVNRTIQACSVNVTISGPANICAIATYTLSNNLPATWSITSNPGNTFAITSPTTNTNSVTVRACPRPTVQTGTLTAIVNGVPIHKTITACNTNSLSITGGGLFPAVCGSMQETFEVRNVPAGSTVNWSISNTLSIVSQGMFGASNELEENSELQTDEENSITYIGILDPGILIPVDPNPPIINPPTQSTNSRVIVKANPSLPFNHCGSGWVSASVQISGCQPIVLPQRNITVGTGPDSRPILSLRYGHHISGMPFCEFEDVLTIGGSTILTNNNNLGITRAEWIPRSTTMIHLTHDVPLPSWQFNSMIGANWNMQIMHFDANNRAHTFARVGNQCCWSEPIEIVYWRGSECPSGGIIIHFSPNPVNDKLTITFTIPQPENEIDNAVRSVAYSVKLIDGLGRTQRENQFSHRSQDGATRSVVFDVSQLREGTYYLRIEGGGEIHKEQIVIQRQ
jgi:hypothetical protein